MQNADSAHQSGVDRERKGRSATTVVIIYGSAGIGMVYRMPTIPIPAEPYMMTTVVARPFLSFPYPLLYCIIPPPAFLSYCYQRSTKSYTGEPWRSPVAKRLFVLATTKKVIFYSMFQRYWQILDTECHLFFFMSHISLPHLCCYLQFRFPFHPLSFLSSNLAFLFLSFHFFVPFIHTISLHFSFLYLLIYLLLCLPLDNLQWCKVNLEWLFPCKLIVRHLPASNGLTLWLYGWHSTNWIVLDSEILLRAICGSFTCWKL